MPIFPDYFCYQTVSNMSTILKRWNESIDYFRQTHLDKNENKLPQNIKPQFLGTITQNFNDMGEKYQLDLKNGKKKSIAE